MSSSSSSFNLTGKSTSSSSSNSIVLKNVDVLLGRGKGTYGRQGNQAFRRIIASYVASYSAATKNKDKIRITDEVVSLVQDTGGRFVDLDTDTGEFYEVSHTEARMKVSQALRHRRIALQRAQQNGPNCSTRRRSRDTNAPPMQDLQPIPLNGGDPQPFRNENDLAVVEDIEGLEEAELYWFLPEAAELCKHLDDTDTMWLEDV